MEDGVEVIVNHLEPYKIKGEPSTLHLTEEFTIDTERDEITDIGLIDINSFDVDTEGNICFLKPLRPKEELIYIFDKNGKFISSFGKKGLGPAEIGHVFHISINIRDEIIIPDSVKRRLLFFRKDGNLINEIPLDSSVRKTVPLDNGKYLIYKMTFARQENISQSLIILCTSELQEIKGLKKIESTHIHPGSTRVKGIYPTFVWSVSKQNIFVEKREKEYEILVYDLEGKLQRKVRKEYVPISISEEHKRKFLKAIESMGGKALMEKVYFPKYWPPYRYFFTDDEGRLFVMTYEKSKNPNEYMYDIFNSNGAFIGKISLGNIQKFQLGELELDVKIKNSRLYCLREKESGYKELVVYKMRWE